VLRDAEIAQFLAEAKPITRAQIHRLLTPREPRRRGARKDRRASVVCRGASGNKFVAFTRWYRENEFNPHDFSVGLLYVPPGGKGIILLRCNGWHGPHTNRLEKSAQSKNSKIPANTFHVHRITERYQEEKRVENYAEATDEFFSFASALHYMIDAFGFVVSDDPFGTGSQHPLFPSGSHDRN